MFYDEIKLKEKFPELTDDDLFEIRKALIRGNTKKLPRRFRKYFQFLKELDKVKKETINKEIRNSGIKVEFKRRKEWQKQ